MQKVWRVATKAPQSFFDTYPEIDEVVAQLLYIRGIRDPESIELFLTPEYSEHVYDPFLFRDMRKAIARIWDAVDAGEKILLYGDYDADGVCSTAMMADFLKNIGHDNLEIILPHRSKDGYGLNEKTVPKVLALKPDLVITLDCGSTSVFEIATITETGTDVIVVDHHHEPEELPECYALLNCSFASEKYPTKTLCAGGMAYKVIQGLVQHAQDTRATWDKPEGMEKWYLDLAAIATVADMMPLLGENRVLVKYGLMVLNKTRRPGLQALYDVAGLRKGAIDEYHLGFVLGPRINAAGRINHSLGAFELLMETDNEKAMEQARSLQEDNANRQKITREYVAIAKEQVQDQLAQNAPLLAVFGEDWNVGLVGLVAGRLLEAYQRPVIVMSTVDGVTKGSGRSTKGFHMTEGLEAVSDMLTHFGGHAQACGFTLSTDINRDDFVEAFRAQASKALHNSIPEPELAIDMELEIGQIDWKLFEALEDFKPFGQDAPKPVFVSKNVLVQAHQTVGSENKHLRLTVADAMTSVSRKAIAFNFGNLASELDYGSMADMVYTIDVNEWNGSRELQLKVMDIKKNNSK